MAPASVRNRLLRSLPTAELSQLRPDLDPVAFETGEIVHDAFRPVSEVLFVESGFLSCLAGSSGRDQTEVALIGPEGLAGLPLALGTGTSPFRVVANQAGEGFRLPAARIDGHFKGTALGTVVLRFAHVQQTQIAETGRANARQSVEARLARWLLMAHDRIGGNEIALTHENLSQRLGVRRPGITVSLHILEGERMIRARRGSIEILDRNKLIRTANGSYGLPEAEYERLFGNPTAPA